MAHDLEKDIKRSLPCPLGNQTAHGKINIIKWALDIFDFQTLGHAYANNIEQAARLS